jgi:release factor glutamine methyltransferase
MIMPSISEHLRIATALLQPCSDSPRLDAEVLLAKVLSRPRSTLITNGDEPLAQPMREEFERLLGERQRGVPVAYLTGTREFWSLPLHVTPDVLVPRPETEELVELILGRLPAERDARVLDLGTGSGAIALAIASERPRARVIGTDVSQAALDIAAGNAGALGLTNVEWRRGSWFDAVAHQRYDIIVSNPPYVASRDPALKALHGEPLVALSSGPMGWEAFVAIIAGAPLFLTDHGLLALEHGLGQAPALGAILEARGFRDVSSHNDRAGHARVMLATFYPSTQEPS